MSPNPNPTLKIALLVATYRRIGCLERMLGSVAGALSHPWVAIVVDNGVQPEVEALIGNLGGKGTYIPLEGNPGCSAGLRAAEERAIADPDITHLVIVDDDAVLGPQSIDYLIEACERLNVGIAVPLIEDEAGRVTSFPGLKNSKYWKWLKSCPPAEEFSKELCREQAEPRVTWFPGVCCVFPRTTLNRIGLHDARFWMMGEDLDFSLRITSRLGGVLIPAARASHLPPGPSAPTPDNRFGYFKDSAMIVNSLYLILWTSHGRGLVRHLPGNILRWFKKYPGSLVDLVPLLLIAVRRQRAGDVLFNEWKTRGRQANLGRVV